MRFRASMVALLVDLFDNLLKNSPSTAARRTTIGLDNDDS
jgi:hypothetical protein